MEIDKKLIPKIDFSEYSKDRYELNLSEYEIKVENDKTYAVRKQSSYLPKTYFECCNVLGEKPSTLNDHGYRGKELYNLQKLLICRDAYWKVLGWEPDFDTYMQTRYVITNTITIVKTLPYYLLTFPSKDVCDKFVECFRELINDCRQFI